MDDNLFRLVEMLQEQYQKVYLMIVSTVTEAIDKLSEPVDVVWLHLPMPGLQSNVFINSLLATPDLASRVGTVDPVRAMESVIGPIVTKGISRQLGKWVWFRTRTDEERNWVRHLLGQCKVPSK